MSPLKFGHSCYLCRQLRPSPSFHLELSLGTSSRISHYPQLDDIIEPRSIRIGIGISTSSCRSEVTIRLTGSAMSPTITLQMDGVAGSYVPTDASFESA